MGTMPASMMGTENNFDFVVLPDINTARGTSPAEKSPLPSASNCTPFTVPLVRYVIFTFGCELAYSCTHALISESGTEEPVPTSTVRSWAASRAVNDVQVRAKRVMVRNMRTGEANFM